MRLFFGAIALLLLSVALTLVMLQDPGYVLVEYSLWTLETSLAVALALLLVLFTVFYLIVRLVLGVLQAPRRLRLWDERRERRGARQALIRGLLDLAEGNWQRAEQNLVRWADRSEMPLLNYLSAARAAQQQGRDEQRDRYLRLAHGSMPAAEVAVSLTQAELQLAHQQYEQALATLTHLRQVAPRHVYVLQLLRTLYERLSDWQKLLELLPELRRQRIAGERELGELELRVQRGLLQQKAARDNRVALDAHWLSLPRGLQQNPELLDCYSLLLTEGGDDEAAERLLRDHLPAAWTPQLVERYGRLAAADAKAQLATAEAWLPEHSGDPTLLLTLGRLCLRNRLWGKARSCFEASIGAGGQLRGAAYQELGALLERMGDTERALACYREGLELVTGKCETSREGPSAQILRLSLTREARGRQG